MVYTTCPEHKCTCLAPPELWVAALGEVGPSHSLGTQSEADCAGGGSGGGGVFGATERKDGGALLQKYSRVILEQFVSSSKQMRWCPAPGCERVIMAGAGVANVRCGPGGCGNAFCFKCGEEAHQPSSCDELVTWTEKCQNESETANWILANTKRCPKCNTRIEKNQVGFIFIVYLWPCTRYAFFCVCRGSCIMLRMLSSLCCCAFFVLFGILCRAATT